MIKKLFKKLMPGGYEVKTKTGVEAQFSLLLDQDVIGQLGFANNLWTFEYSTWFKNQNSIKPLTQFPNINEKYESKELWPFFVSRIPSKKQPQVKEYITEHPEESNNLVALLGRFAAHSVNNPFTLRML